MEGISIKMVRKYQNGPGKVSKIETESKILTRGAEGGTIGTRPPIGNWPGIGINGVIPGKLWK